MKMKQYGVWKDGEGEQFWMIYDSIKDVISDQGDDIEVYELNASYLGTYKKLVKYVKVKKA